ncbi:hypothetical protein cand_007110 [Cryptosporidium andersoni]|uniref:Uncharacterized protein n=1 Tax=Cryptosporidium andersoni TaxID=117008 RepID=A0A1J4MPD7_9CRYT|nr:hypothetical protein cand_007110 [Cryptosporidium andersoni]
MVRKTQTNISGTILDSKRRTLPNFRFVSHPIYSIFPMDITNMTYEEYWNLYNEYKTKAFHNELEPVIPQHNDFFMNTNIPNIPTTVYQHQVGAPQYAIYPSLGPI